jgi:3D (Asp-Asp-Asp) domain-containing protein
MKKLIYSFVIAAIILSSVITIIVTTKEQETVSSISVQTIDLYSLINQECVICVRNFEIVTYEEVLKYLETESKKINEVKILSQDDSQSNERDINIEYDYKIYEVTAYTAGYESTGKTPSHSEYGITASGKKVKENKTIACPKRMSFGTKIYIPYFDNTFTCEDRGSAITKGHLDVYIADLEEALEFGRQQLKVAILDE